SCSLQLAWFEVVSPMASAALRWRSRQPLRRRTIVRAEREQRARAQFRRMKAETVIATHGNTDFDAFAAMLAARRLYPNAVACVAGSLHRNVREFARLHADQLDLVEAARPDLDAIRRLVVVEPTDAGRRRRPGEDAAPQAVAEYALHPP